ncbi:MAG: LysM domain-containing protein [Longimicrobiaceae bacterium]
MSTNPLEALLLVGAAASRFPPNSRYHGVATATITLPDGRQVAYLRRRFVPPPEALALLYTVRVAEGDRLDNLAATHLGDPELFWRIGDANAALRPDELTEEVGRELRITLPEGIPGIENG